MGKVGTTLHTWIQGKRKNRETGTKSGLRCIIIPLKKDFPRKWEVLKKKYTKPCKKWKTHLKNWKSTESIKEDCGWAGDKENMCKQVIGNPQKWVELSTYKHTK